MRNWLFFLLFFASLSANASMFGEENIALAKMVAQLEMLYTQTVDMVKQATVTSETITKVNDAVKTVKEDYDAVKNSFLWDIEGMLTREYEDLASMFDLNGMTLEQKIDAMTGLIDRRIAGSDDPDEKALLKKKKMLLKKEKFLMQLERAAAENLKKSKSGLTDKAASQNIAINTSIMAQMAARQERREQVMESERTEDALFVNKLIKNNAALSQPSSE